MTRKELEHRIIKALHKANRTKPLKLKLEKVDEVLDVIQRLLDGMNAETQGAESRAQAETSSKRLERYIELCHIHKLKFQLDALLHGAIEEQQALAKHPEQMTQQRFDSFIRRLNVVLDTDPEHPEALALLEQLNGSYPQYAQASCVRDVSIGLPSDKATDLSIAFESPAKLIFQNEKLAAEHSKFTQNSGSHNTDESTTIRLQFSLKQLDTFAIFHEELHTSAGYKIFVNGARMKEASFTEWFHCYQRRVKADNAQYCYGASPFTLNVFGCHKVSQPDVAGQLEQCWFYRGELEEKSGLFLIANEEIARQTRQHLESCSFCPFLNEEKLHLGIGLLPQYINPECDKHWDYLYENGRRIGVIPSGSEIAIARQLPEGDKIDRSNLIEVTSSPYAHRMLEYVKTQDKRVLCESRYKGITRCMNCGTHYKAHTMNCPRCKSDFVKEALADLDKVLRELSYIQPVKYPSSSQKDKKPQAPDSPQRAVSFDQLWEDPQIRKILSNDSVEKESAQDTAGTPASKLTASIPQEAEDAAFSQMLPQASDKETPRRPTRRRSQASGQFDLHGKLRGLISKKYRERKAIEDAFSGPEDFSLSAPPEHRSLSPKRLKSKEIPSPPAIPKKSLAELAPNVEPEQGSQPEMDEELLDAIKRLKPRQRSELSKRGVVRVIYHATMDKDHCPLCAYLDGMVMDPDDPGTDIFSPPLYPGCTCSREYVLKTEKPSNWPEVNFRFPPKELLSYLQKH